jgi:hypothetical protein
VRVAPAGAAASHASVPAVVLAVAAALLLAAPGCRHAPPRRAVAVHAVFGVAPQKALASALVPRSVELGLGSPDASESARIVNASITSWSSDGKMLAVVGGRGDDPVPGLWVVPLASTDGFAVQGQPSRVASVALDAAFAPSSASGFRLALTVQDSPDALSLKVYESSTKALRTVAPTASAPAWSPDGSRLLFLTPGGAGDGTLDIAEVSADGGSSTTLIPDVGLMRPVWTGGKDRFVYFLDAKTGRAVRQAIAPAGPGPTRLAGSSRQELGPERADELSASRDGSVVAYLAITAPATQGSSGLYEPAKGHAMLWLARGRGAPAWKPFGDLLVSTPRISPDGRRVWASVDGGLVVADTGGSRPGSRFGFIPVGQSRAYLPQPSPDGGRIVAVSPESEVAAALVAVRLWGFPAGRSYLVVTDRLARSAQAETALEPLHALEPTSVEATSIFPPGYPDAFPSEVFAPMDRQGALPAGKTIVAAGRYGALGPAQAAVAALKAAHLRPSIVSLDPP